MTIVNATATVTSSMNGFAAIAPILKREPAAVERITLDDVVARFQTRLHLPDAIPLLGMLGTIAANYLPGDPVWLGLIAPSSSTKTELLNATSKLANVKHAATLTPASLLSGTSKKERAQNAKGGLLKEMGTFGILICKDFTSILSENRDAQAEVLAAFREIYDGAWTRHVGTDGGQSLAWSGKMGFLFGATPAYDSRHAIVGAMGERFLLCRLQSAGREQAIAALARRDRGAMRQELAEAVADLFAQPRRDPRRLTTAEHDQLVSLADLTVNMRSVVERDRHSREIESIHGAEGPARLVLALQALLDGLDTLGCDRAQAMRVVQRVASDSVPPLRRKAYDIVCSGGGVLVETTAVAAKMGLPTVTVRRALEDLAAYGLLTRHSQGQGNADQWGIGETGVDRTRNSEKTHAA